MMSSSDASYDSEADQLPQQLNKVVENFMTMRGPRFRVVRFEEKSYPVANCSFTDATFKMEYCEGAFGVTKKAVWMKDFFKNGLHELQSGGTSPNAQQACKRLKDFFSHVPVTLDHLKKCKKEEDFNCLIALEVLIPLSSGTCLIDQESAAGRKEERLKLPNEFGKKGLVIGYSRGYHGELDMVVIPDYQEDLPVLISSEEERPRPTPKKAKTETLQDYIAALDPPISLNTLSRSVAMIITFSHIQKECFKTSYAVPMLRVNPEGVVVLVYDSHKDILLISEFYKWDKFAFLVTWLVLHYSLFPPSVLSDSLVDCCSGYSTAIKDHKFGEPWYLESERVLATNYRNTLYEFMPVNIIRIG